MSRLPTAACLAALVCAALPAAEPPALEPGARGTLLTTLEGREPEEIPVRYLGSYHDVFPGRDLHLIELEGARAERIGAASGMSGSPVYFDGQLVGALSYRLGSLPKSPIAGVTPIGDMLDAVRTTRGAAGEGGGDLRPIATPVMLGALARPLREWLAPQLEQLGFAAVAGGASGSRVEGAEIVPGAPVGVGLVQGDVRIAASGTVTHVDGQVVYAFGHPFLGSGRVEMPMVRAEVIHTLADWAGSFHMVNLGPAVGAIVEDRQTAIVGRLGQVARMIPVDVAVHGGAYGEERFHFDVVAGSKLTPLLGAVATANALFLSNGYGDEATVLARGRLRLRDLPAVPLEMAFSASQGSDPALGVAATLLAALQELWDNPFEAVVVDGLELALEVRSQPVSYRVEKLHYDRGPLEPGQPLVVRCLLREHRGAKVVRDIAVPLPDRLPDRGDLTLAVSSPAGIDRVLGSPLLRRLRSAKDLGQIVTALGEQRAAHRLTAVVYEPGGTVVARGSAWSELPPTAERLLALQAGTAGGPVPTQHSALGRAELELDGPVEGGLQLRLRVRRGVIEGVEPGEEGAGAVEGEEGP